MPGLLCLFVSANVHAQPRSHLTTAQFWASGFAASPRTPFIGDVDGDGRDDILAFYPKDDCIIDLMRTSAIGKPRYPTQARTRFGKDGLIAVAGKFTQPDRDSVLAVFADGSVRVAHQLKPDGSGFERDDLAATIPAALIPHPPVRAVAADFTDDGKPDVLLCDATGRLLLLINDWSPDRPPHFSPISISNRLPRLKQLAVGDFSNSSRKPDEVINRPLIQRSHSDSEIVWKEDTGIVYRAFLELSTSERIYRVINDLKLQSVKKIITGMPNDFIAVGHFLGGKSMDIIVGQKLLPGGDSQHAAVQSTLPTAAESKGDLAWLVGDFDGHGKDDLLRIRRSGERFIGDDLVIHFSADGSATPLNGASANIALGGFHSTSNDGLPDIWKSGIIHPGDLDLAALGCSIQHHDAIVEIQPIANVSEPSVHVEMERAIKYFASLPVKNPDGSTGIYLHVIYREPIPLAEKDLPWWTLGEKHHPANHRGVTHWLVVYNGGGGQSSEMADRGSCGVSHLYATFLHEFGHQLGLDHTGHWGPSWCPTYPSLMNYAYNYQLGGKESEIGYSDGRLSSVVLSEKHLSEKLPLEMSKIAFLAGPPYFYTLKPSEDGKSTLIDWNRNGILGEENISADINYGYSTQAGERSYIGKTYSAPALVSFPLSSPTQGKGSERLLLFCGRLADGTMLPTADAAAKLPGLSPDQPGKLRLRIWQGENADSEGMKWSDELDVEASGVTGDPSAAYAGGAAWVSYPTLEGVAIRRITLDADGHPLIGPKVLVPDSKGAEPTLTSFHGHSAHMGTSSSVPVRISGTGRLALLLWRGAKEPVGFRLLSVEGDALAIDRETKPGFISNQPVGAVAGADDSGSQTIWIGLTQDQPGRAASRWQVRQFRLVAAASSALNRARGESSRTGQAETTASGAGRAALSLEQMSIEWVGGEMGSERGSSRVTLLRDEDPRFGIGGQLYFMTCGSFSSQSPWSCHYVATRIANKNFHGGWLTRRYYDEWTQSRSAPAACFFRGDIAFAARWFGNVRASENDNLFVGFKGSGIETAPMGDFDDISLIRDVGLSHSIAYTAE